MGINQFNKISFWRGRSELLQKLRIEKCVNARPHRCYTGVPASRAFRYKQFFSLTTYCNSRRMERKGWELRKHGGSMFCVQR